LGLALSLELLDRVVHVNVLMLVGSNKLLHGQMKVVLDQMVLVNELRMVLRVARRDCSLKLLLSLNLITQSSISINRRLKSLLHNTVLCFNFGLTSGFLLLQESCLLRLTFTVSLLLQKQALVLPAVLLFEFPTLTLLLFPRLLLSE